MNITLNIQADSPKELEQAIQGLSASFIAHEAPKEEKPKRKQKEEQEKSPDTEPAKQEEPQEDSAPEQVFSPEELRAKAGEVAKAGKKDEVKSLLADFGVKAVTAVPEARSAEFMAALEALA